jgi:hypothetical protein
MDDPGVRQLAEVFAGTVSHDRVRAAAAMLAVRSLAYVQPWWMWCSGVESAEAEWMGQQHDVQ